LKESGTKVERLDLKTLGWRKRRWGQRVPPQTIGA